MTGLAIFVILWIACAVAGALIAESKGRNPGLWAVLCLIFGLVGILVISVLSSEKPPAQQPMAAFTRAPSAATPTATMTGDLQQLISMHERGALSDEEFAAAKARVLEGSVSAPGAQQHATPVVPAEDPNTVKCTCGTRNRLNRSTCWSCNSELPSLAVSTD